MPQAVILTALPVEYLAVRSHLTDLQEEMHSQGTIYERGKFIGNNQTWEVGIAEVGAGNAGAAVEAERAIAYFKPDILFFVGIAGGIKDVAIGDVVAATKVYGYESGKVGEQFFTRPALGQSAHALVHRAKAEARKGEWLKRLSSSLASQPHVFVAPIAAGEKVIASKESDVFNFIRASYNDAIAVEMEGFGFLSAAFAYPDTKAIVIRGISDLIEGKNNDSIESEQLRQERASYHASAFAFEILAKLGSKQSFSEDRPQVVNTSQPNSDKSTAINRYREKFEEYAADGTISSIESAILQDLQIQLNLTELEVSLVQDEVLEPYKKYQKNLEQYERYFAKLVAEEGYPFTEKTLADLKKLKDYLNLKSEDIGSFEEGIGVKSLKQGDVDYSNLYIFLVEKEWESANEETWNLLCRIAGKPKQSLLNRKDIERIPIEKLRIIDRLWLRLSKGRLGFSVQMKIYQGLNELKTELERIKEFGRQVNWLKLNPFFWSNELKIKKSEWSNEKVNIDPDKIPTGFLPICIWQMLETKEFKEWKDKVREVESAIETERFMSEGSDCLPFTMTAAYERIKDAKDWLKKEEPKIKQKEREGERLWEGITFLEHLGSCKFDTYL